METLRQLGLKHGTDKATHHQFCDFYEANLDKSKIKSLLEIGVRDGASLKMWREWLLDAQITGIDINPPIEVEGCIVLQGDASSTDLEGLNQQEFDVIIDDGSHKTGDQLFTFNALWQQCKYAYIVEDVHTSFNEEYVNTEGTAYDYLRVFAKVNNLRLIEFWRNPEDKTDSGTLIIFK